MKKHTKNIIVVLLFIVSTAISIHLFIVLNNNRLKDDLKQQRSSFELILNITAEMLSSGYFQWTELYEAVNSNDYDFINNSFLEIYQMSPYIEQITVIDTPPLKTEENYIFETVGNYIYSHFPIFDSSQDNVIEDKHVKIKLNIEKILLSVQTMPHFSFNIGRETHDFVMGLTVRSDHKPIMFFQLISSLSIGLLASLLIRRSFRIHSHFFYETRGLEKVIFLFEHTEKFSANHSKHVAGIAYMLGKIYGLKRKQLKDLKVAALLHDIGKISIPRALLNKPGKLTEEEFEHIKEHSVISESILKSFEELSHLRKFVRHHHEKMDGTGYPDGLKGEEIPLQSRIIAIADIFEALTGARPYREPLAPSDAIKKMHSMSLDKNILKLLQDNLLDICLKVDRKQRGSLLL